MIGVDNDPIYAIRCARFAELVKQRCNDSVPDFGRAYGYSRSQIYQFLSSTYNNGRTIGERAAREIERRCELPARWLDDVAGDHAPAPARPAPIGSLTIRDHFAGLALTTKIIPEAGMYVVNFERVAAACYQMADAMLAERAKGGAV